MVLRKLRGCDIIFAVMRNPFRFGQEVSGCQFNDRKKIGLSHMTIAGNWLRALDSSRLANWRGLAFERLCLQHIREIV